MKIRLNSKDDAMYIKFDDSKIEDSEEIKPGIVLDYDANDRVIGIEILQFCLTMPQCFLYNRTYVRIL